VNESDEDDGDDDRPPAAGAQVRGINNMSNRRKSTLRSKKDGVRKAETIEADEPTFSEKRTPVQLSERDAKRFLEALENPPVPNPAARRAAKRFKKHHS
jgi:hypothetical protein